MPRTRRQNEHSASSPAPTDTPPSDKSAPDDDSQPDVTGDRPNSGVRRGASAALQWPRRFLTSQPETEPDADNPAAGRPNQGPLRAVSPWDEIEGMNGRPAAERQISPPTPTPNAATPPPARSENPAPAAPSPAPRPAPEGQRRPTNPPAPTQFRPPPIPIPPNPAVMPPNAPDSGTVSPWRDWTERRSRRWKPPAPETATPVAPVSLPPESDAAPAADISAPVEPDNVVDLPEESPAPDAEMPVDTGFATPEYVDASFMDTSVVNEPADELADEVSLPQETPIAEIAEPVAETPVPPPMLTEFPLETIGYLPETASPRNDLTGQAVPSPMVEPPPPTPTAMYPTRLSDRLYAQLSPPESVPGPINAAASPVIGARSDGSPFSPPSWGLPATDLLAPPETYSAPHSYLDQMARHIEETLAEHGVMVECNDIKAGPRIVRFGLVPGWVPRRGESRNRDRSDEPRERSRVKVQSVLTREKDLALALKTPHLRIEAPVPGEALIGLEVPNPSPGKVPLRNVMDGRPFTEVAAKGGLPIALGEDTGGTPVVMDLATLPHVLIAGATGSGKSVCINSIVASFLLTKPPDQLRMLMVDPKRVELTPFNGIPHLIAPVITEPDEVNPALRAVMREMFRRYKLMEEIGARNIAAYNAKSTEQMPFLVLVVDELADLMMVGGFEIEENLVRLAQLGRATGIHLVLATQRPSVNVVTGLLKANIPARVAFAVASQVDSRVILDTVGAEKLLGKGDMLLLNNDSPKPRRVQGTLVLDEEVDRVVEFWQQQKGPPLPVISLEEPDEEVEDARQVDQDLLAKARELASRNPNLSPSLLQRRLNIGELKAREILEELEDEGLLLS